MQQFAEFQQATAKKSSFKLNFLLSVCKGYTICRYAARIATQKAAKKEKTLSTAVKMKGDSDVFDLIYDFWSGSQVQKIGLEKFSYI